MEDFDLGSIGHSKGKPAGRLQGRIVAQGGRVGEERCGRGPGTLPLLFSFFISFSQRR